MIREKTKNIFLNQRIDRVFYISNKLNEVNIKLKGIDLIPKNFIRLNKLKLIENNGVKGSKKILTPIEKKTYGAGASRKPMLKAIDSLPENLMRISRYSPRKA